MTESYTPHPYEPSKSRDISNGQYPCRICGRFKGSYLHPKENPESETPDDIPLRPAP